MRANDLPVLDTRVFGHRLRHARKEAGLTLAELGERVSRQASYLSMVENGHRDPPLGLVDALAAALGVGVGSLLEPEAPTRRAHLEIEVERAQEDPLYRELGLPHFKASARVPDEALEHIVGLYAELHRRSLLRSATPEEARRANADLRDDMRRRGNYFPEIEEVAAEALRRADYGGSGAVPPRLLSDVAAGFGFTVRQVQDLPTSARSITDGRSRVIYIPQRDELRTRAARTVVLQTLGHFALGHRDPVDFGDFLRQRVEANYFAAAVLMPEAAAVAFLDGARAERDLSVEDLKEIFYVSYEMAAHRFTNLATHHLGIETHFIRSDEQGVIWKAYENDGVPFPADPFGAIEGQRLCRRWGTRQAFGSDDQFAVHYQYTDTPAGTFWCATHVEADREPPHAVTVGARFEDSRFFRGRETTRRSTSTCPDESCCRRPPAELAERWDGIVWPAARTQSHVLAALPAGTFPGVDMTDVYEFVERHTPH
ncbi:MAG TPA: helix-turn-helix domain-containing protein [Acidimicrobiia bacterium]|nr:helix-turn-helix domain-containing protein [Acidimicrobiia bacterium]